MNRTNFEHAGYALLMQIVIGLLYGIPLDPLVITSQYVNGF